MNKEELTQKIMKGLRESLNESALPKVSSDDNEIYDEADGRTIARIWDDGSVKFKNGLSQEEKALYKASILNNRRLCNWFDIREDSFINESLNESKSLDLKTNKDHKAAYNSFVKWYNHWKEKLGREEIRALVKKMSNDALGDNLDTINESRVPARIEDANQHLAFDIFLTYENTREIYDNVITPMADNLLRRLRKGQELSFDVLVNSSVIENHAKAAIDEYKRKNGRIIVDTATRKALKAKIAEYLINLANDDYSFELHDMESNLHKWFLGTSKLLDD